MAQILIMEDDEAQALAWRELLSANGYQVSLTASGSEAWGHIVGGAFDLLLTDILVKKDGRYAPDGGLLLIGRVRREQALNPSAALARLKIVAVSGGAHSPSGYDPLSLAEMLGATKVLRKPVAAEELLRTVHEELTRAA